MVLAGICRLLLLFHFYFEGTSAAECAAAGLFLGPSDYDFFLSNDRSVRYGYLVRNQTLTATCCGVITEWQTNVLEAGSMHFQVWRPVNASNHQYRLIGNNSQSVPVGDASTSISDKARQIPILTGDSIGWYSDTNDILKFDNSGGYTDYYRVNMAASGGTYPPAPDSTFTFTSAVQTARQFGIRAKITPGDPPTFTNLPIDGIILLDEDNAVDQKTVYKVGATSNYTMSTLTFSIEPSDLFRIHPNTGELTVAGSLNGTGHTLTSLNCSGLDLAGLVCVDTNENASNCTARILNDTSRCTSLDLIKLNVNVTDGCNTVMEILSIQIMKTTTIEPTTTMNAPTTEWPTTTDKPPTTTEPPTTSTTEPQTTAEPLATTEPPATTEPLATTESPATTGPPFRTEPPATGQLTISPTKESTTLEEVKSAQQTTTGHVVKATSIQTALPERGLLETQAGIGMASSLAVTGVLAVAVMTLAIYLRIKTSRRSLKL